MLLKDFMPNNEDDKDPIEFTGKCLFSGEHYVLIELTDGSGREQFFEKKGLMMWPDQGNTGNVMLTRGYADYLIEKGED